jgi:hypothetical protein
MSRNISKPVPDLPKPVPEVRARLQQFTSDAFDAFCQDHFPEIYMEFGGGMSSPAKIIRLIDYYIRSEEYRTRLIHVLFNDIGSSQSTVAKTMLHAYRLVEIHHFDLVELALTCLDAYLGGSGPLVIVLHSTFHQLLDCLRLRIISDLGEEMFYDDLPEPFPISYKNINEEQRFLVNCKHLLSDYVILRVYIVEDQASLDAIWQIVMNTFVDQTKYRVIVIFGVNGACTPPAMVLQLDPPRFKKGDIRLWLRRVKEYRHLTRELSELWEQMIWEEFYPYGDFNIIRAYQHLDFATKLLGITDFDENYFRSQLERRRIRYV